MTQTADLDSPSGGLAAAHCEYHSRISAVCSWMVILASVAVIVALNRVSSEQSASEESKDALSPNVQLEITARYAVGTSVNFFNLREQRPQTLIDPTAVYLQQLDSLAKSTPDRLCVAIVAGELRGASAALQRIDALGAALRSPSLAADAAALRSVYSSGSKTLNGEARQRVVRRYGWFGHLALGFAKDANDPDRKIAIDAAVRATAVILVVGGIGLMALTAGFVLLVIALVRLTDGKIRRMYVPAATNTGPFLEAFAIYLALMIVVSSLVGRFSGHLTLNAAYLVAGCLPVATALAWPLLRGISWSELRYGLGWHAGTGVIREMLLGITGYIAGLPLLAAGVMVTVVLMRLSGAQTAHPIVNQAAGLQSALRLFLLACVFAPLAEESLFRGALFHHLHAWWISALIVSLLFAAIHPQGWAAIPPLAMIAITLAAIREWRGTIVASATAHALNNGMIMLVLVVATS